jgi:hypothetical protein
MTQPSLDTDETVNERIDTQDSSPAIKAIKALESYRKKDPLKSTLLYA